MATITNQPSRMSIFDYIGGTDRQLVIPVYQRNYSWIAEDQVKRLLSDILNVVEGKSRNHFTGIFMSVLVPISSRFNQVQLVDGQQRLTTLFLLLWALKYTYLDDENVEEIDKLLYNSQLVQRNHGEKYRLKLKPLVGDNNVYQKIANGTEKKDYTEDEKNSRVYKNYEFIVKFLKNHNNLNIEKVLDALANMDIVDIPLSDEDDPQQIFESINALGLELSPIDLIRNLVLMKLEADEQDIVYDECWKKIENVFSSKQKDKLGDVLRLFVAIKTFKLVKSEEMYYEFSNLWRDIVWNHEENCGDSSDRNKFLSARKEFLKLIEDYTKFYKELYFDSSYPVKDSKYRQILDDFRRINSTTIAPFMLEVYYLYKCEKVTEESLMHIIKIMNSYVIRRECAGYQMNDASRFFPQLLRNVMIELGGDYTNIVNVTLKYLVNMNKNNNLGIPTDESIKNYLLTKNAYTLSHCLLILARIENSKNATPIVDYSSLSVEHIMPQTQDDPGYWNKIIGDEIDNYETHCNKIGNLTIVSIKDNSAMKNFSFDKKKEYLTQSKHIKLNEKILEKDIWGISEIENRTLELISLINKEFPYESANFDKKLSYQIHFEKLKAKNIYTCDAVMFIGGSVKVAEDCIVVYKTNSAYLSNDSIRNAIIDGILIQNNDNTITLKKDSVLGSIEILTELILGEVPRNLNSVWSVSDGVSIDNILSLLR